MDSTIDIKEWVPLPYYHSLCDDGILLIKNDLKKHNIKYPYDKKIEVWGKFKPMELGSIHPSYYSRLSRKDKRTLKKLKAFIKSLSPTDDFLIELMNWRAERKLSPFVNAYTQFIYDEHLTQVSDSRPLYHKIGVVLKKEGDEYLCQLLTAGNYKILFKVPSNINIISPTNYFVGHKLLPYYGKFWWLDESTPIWRQSDDVERINCFSESLRCVVDIIYDITKSYRFYFQREDYHASDGLYFFSDGKILYIREDVSGDKYIY